MRVFVTGTDTGVGKTYVTALLARALREGGLDTIALKPVCSGDRQDAEILRDACGKELTLDEVNPIFFQTPLAPLAAARAESRLISISDLRQWFEKVSTGRRSVLVEGAGGWMVPMADGVLIADFAAALALPVVVVVANRLGCINHALLTVAAIRARGLECSGIILNTLAADDSTSGNRALLEEFCDAPVLCEISPGQPTLDATKQSPEFFRTRAMGVERI